MTRQLVEPSHSRPVVPWFKLQTLISSLVEKQTKSSFQGTRLTEVNPWLGYFVWSKIILKLSSGKKYVASMSPCITKLWSIYINIPYIIVFNQYIHFQVFCFTFILPINLNIFKQIVPKSRILVPWYDSTNIYGVCNPS